MKYLVMAAFILLACFLAAVTFLKAVNPDPEPRELAYGVTLTVSSLVAAFLTLILV